MSKQTCFSSTGNVYSEEKTIGWKFKSMLSRCPWIYVCKQPVQFCVFTNRVPGASVACGLIQGVTVLLVPHSIRIKSRAIGIIKRTIFCLRLPEGLLQRLLMVGVFYTICYIFISSLCVCKIAFVWGIGLTRTVKENCKQTGTHT